jgi:hypothetical protein
VTQGVSVRFLTVLITSWLIVVGFLIADESEIDLPEGFSLASFAEEDFIENENTPQNEPGIKYTASAKKAEPEEEPPPAIGILEAHPSAIVANCVNAISGTFFDCQVDLSFPVRIPLLCYALIPAQKKNGIFNTCAS